MDHQSLVEGLRSITHPTESPPIENDVYDAFVEAGILSEDGRIARAIRRNPNNGQPFTADVLGRGLEMVEFELSWNMTGRQVEGRSTTEAEADRPDWRSFAGDRDEVMESIAMRFTDQHGRPWRLGSRLEDRLVKVVAKRNCRTGDGSAVFHAVREWASVAVSGQSCTLGDALEGAECLNRYESAKRVPKSVYADARSALQAEGWEYRSIRVIGAGGSPTYRWVKPGQRRGVSLRSVDSR